MGHTKLTYSRLVFKLEESIAKLSERFPDQKNASRVEALRAVLENGIATARAGMSGNAKIPSPGKLKHKIAADIQAAHEGIDAAAILQSISSLRKRSRDELPTSPKLLHPTPKQVKRTFLPLPPKSGFAGMSSEQIFFMGVEYGVENAFLQTTDSLDNVKRIFAPQQRFRNFVMDQLNLTQTDEASHISISDDQSDSTFDGDGD